MSEQITVRSYAKINLSIDVGNVNEDGYHEVDMILQQIAFHDDVRVVWSASDQGGKEEQTIKLESNRAYLPTDRRNLAYQAAELMIGRYGKNLPGGQLSIYLKKRIPVAAGLAGGSGNGAAVIHALNILWGLNLSLEEICRLCEELGSDVPFCAIGQARRNPDFPKYIKEDPMASSCARARGRGTDMEPIRGIDAQLLIGKPNFSVSTAEVYRGIDRCTVHKRPDNDRFAEALRSGQYDRNDFVNVLEEYTLAAYPEVEELKHLIEDQGAEIALMSGSGPTCFGIFRDQKSAEKACRVLREKGYEAYNTRTTV